MERDGEGKVVQLRKLRKGNEKTSAQLRFARITSQGKVGALFQKLFNGFCALVNYFPASRVETIIIVILVWQSNIKRC